MIAWTEEFRNSKYYTVRAVDPAGNESSNTVQIKVVAVGTSGVVITPTVVAPASVSLSDMQLSVGLTRALRLGLSGADVELLQKVLVQEGVYIGPITGYFGVLTEAAVRKFQAANGLEQVGVVGALTRQAVNARLGGITVPSTFFVAPSVAPAITDRISRSLRKGMSGDEVKILQRILISEALLALGSDTGYFGALTEAAVISFQEKYAVEILMPAGLTKGSGFVGSGTIKKLNTLFPR